MKTNKRSRISLHLAALLPLGLFAACAHTPRYAEPNLPPNQLAVLACTAPVWIVSLDGQSVSPSAFSDLTRVRVSPGAHQVVLSYRRLNAHTAPAPRINGAVASAGEISSAIHKNTDVTTYSLHDISLNFVAKPGFTYVVNEGISANRWNPTVTSVAPNFA